MKKKLFKTKMKIDVDALTKQNHTLTKYVRAFVKEKFSYSQKRKHKEEKF
jgi:hypothetical protein